MFLQRWRPHVERSVKIGGQLEFGQRSLNGIGALARVTNLLTGACTGGSRTGRSGLIHSGRGTVVLVICHPRGRNSELFADRNSVCAFGTIRRFNILVEVH